jgi:hypothetical protein
MLRHAPYAWHGSESVGYKPADTKRLIERGAGDRGHVQDQVPFPKIRQEGPTEERQHRRSGGRQNDRRRHHELRESSDAAEHRFIVAAGPLHQRRFMRFLAAGPPDEQQHRKRRRNGKGNSERSQHGNDVGDAQGAEETASNP